MYFIHENNKAHAIYKGKLPQNLDGSLNLKPYSTISCNVTVTHDDNAVDLVW